MITRPRTALIGFGEVGQILAADLANAGARDIIAFDVLFHNPDSSPSRGLKTLPVTAASSAAEAVRDAELILCAVTAAADCDAAQSVIAGLKPGAFYVDLNSASPGMKQASAALIGAAGGRYVEAAVMTPFPPKRIASPMLLGGPHAAAFLELASPFGFSATIFSETIGKASATKMCRSVMIKGIEALLTESMLAARHYGVEDTVLASLSDLLPVGDWPKLAHYMISRSLEHGVRRAEEMREAARTVEEAGVAPLMSRSIAERQDWAAGHREALGDHDLAQMLDAILTDIDTGKGQALPQTRVLGTHA
jgi:3-hydroxyisobutyrate dehydrogenase-like beta-hydroxyacid dehydrogenase